MDTFLNLPFWLSVTLGVAYGVIWVLFFVVLYAAHQRVKRSRHRTAGASHKHLADSSFYLPDADDGLSDEMEEMSVYDEDDD